MISRKIKFIFCVYILLILILCSGTIDLNKLFNYSNPKIPDYINKDVLSTVPSDNLMDDKIVTLGRVLFYDKKLSTNNSVSCASCHNQKNAFGLNELQGTGVNGLTLRRPMRLVNLQFQDISVGFFWDERSRTLEDLSTIPIQDHIEMGYSGKDGAPNLNDLIIKLNGISYYPTLFNFAFGSDAINKQRIEKALAQFIRSMISYDSKFDSGMLAANSNPFLTFSNFTESENNGKFLFNNNPIKSQGQRTGGGAGCFNCHDVINHHLEFRGANNGVVKEISGSSVFNISKSPSLRDVFNPLGQLNGPLFHNGQAKTFSQLLDHYDTIAKSTSISNFDNRINTIGVLNLTKKEKIDLEAYIKTLSGNDIYTNPKWSDPFDLNGNINISNVTSIIKNSKEIIKIYPTITNDNLNFSGLNNNSFYKIILVNENGKIVIQEKIKGNHQIQISNLSSGFYTLILFEDNTKLISQKIIKL